MPDPRIEYLRGELNEVYVRIQGKTVIVKGELIFLNQDDSVIVATSGDGFGYPAVNLAGTTQAYFEDNLVGVSMSGSVSGTTEDIPVATSGIFRGQIRTGLSATSRHVYPGALVSAGTVGASGVTPSGTTFVVNSLGAADYADCRVGRAVKKEASALSVDFMLMTKMSGSSITTT